MKLKRLPFTIQDKNSKDLDFAKVRYLPKIFFITTILSNFLKFLTFYQYIYLIVDPLSVYVCTSNRTFLLASCTIILVRTKSI